ncbi:MAG: MATE family efflux transporter [Desulfomicrobium escambiense]|nr:MATE family efflux transporter [Desulfomicrobium escambiense]
MDVGHKALFRNTVLNLLGLVVPLAVGFVTIPLVVRALGNERFGILALVWVVFGYFGLFDLGLGRTTTKYIADALGRNESGKLPGYLWTTVLLQTAIGTAAALLSYLAAPLIVRRMLNIPEGFIGETVLTLRLVGLSLPVMFVSSSFRGVLEAAQRFDLVNAVKVPVEHPVLRPAPRRRRPGLRAPRHRRPARRLPGRGPGRLGPDELQRHAATADVPGPGQASRPARCSRSAAGSACRASSTP